MTLEYRPRKIDPNQKLDVFSVPAAQDVSPVTRLPRIDRENGSIIINQLDSLVKDRSIVPYFGELRRQYLVRGKRPTNEQIMEGLNMIVGIPIAEYAQYKSEN